MKTELFELLAPAVPEAEDEVFVYPAAYAQERLWFLDHLDPGSALYNMPVALALHGELAPASLEWAWREIVLRHETLRTTFAVSGGLPVQVITPADGAAARSLPQVDLAGLPPQALRRETERLQAVEASRAFDLARGPLWRATLLRLGAQDHLLLVTIHHIVADGWSLAVFGRELGLLYAAGRTGGLPPLPPLPPLPLQYADYAVWQRDWLVGEVVGEQLAYWRARLAGVPPCAALPLSRPRPAVRGHRGATRAQILPAASRDSLYALAQRTGTTRFMALLAAFAALLHRFTGEVDLVIGTPVAGRTEVETEELIGLFVNTLPLRLDLSGEPSFHQLLTRVRGACLGAFAHQELPFEWLVKELHPERSSSYDPLVQVIFGLAQGLGVKAMELPGLRVEPRELPAGRVKAVKFDLELFMEETPPGLLARLDFSLALLDPCDAARLLESLCVLLAGAAAQPDRPLRGLPVVPAAALHQVLREWNDTRSEYPRGSTIAALFSAQARLTPAATALAVGEEELTYGELEARANRLAHYLRGLGVGPEVPVGLALNRSPQAVVAILAILKAGGAYVPLDPAYPRERLAFMLADSAVPVIVSESRYAAVLAGAVGRDGRPDRLGQPLRIVELDTAAAALAMQSATAPLQLGGSGTADSLAYVMYTSGSTGRPKGVAVCQRAIVRLVRGNHFAALGAGETLLQFAPIAFDASTLEIWGSLLNGGRLVIFPDYAPSLRELGEVVERQLVTTLWLTAGLFHQMVEGALGSLRGVGQLLAGGDVLMAPLVERALAELPGLTLINGYGPTENVTFTCCHRLRGRQRLGASVPIGRPIANTRVYVLDRTLRPVPPGVFGELCTAGDGLARGYLHRPELTAERFVPDPLSGEPGGRLFRTGDLARHLPDGALEFLGRFDQQVKIRGFRVEPGEVEYQLLQHPAVRQAAVVVHEPGPGGHRLAAFFVPRPDAAGKGAAAELLAWLRDRLPAPMIPSALEPVDALPLDPNGKIDRRALVARLAAGPAGTGAPRAAGAVPPRNPVEELLCEICSDLLRLPGIEVHDNFFDLGGHSLLATQVVSRVREVCGVEVPLRALFLAPTMAAFAARVEAARQAGEGRTAPPISRAPRDRPLPASFAQERLWFLDQLGGGDAAYNVPLALRLAGRLEAAALAAALREVVRRHEALRTSFAAADSQTAQVVQVVAEEMALDLPVVDLRPLAALAPAEAHRLALAAALRPFDLRRPPLLRALLLRLPAGAAAGAPGAAGAARLAAEAGEEGEDGEASEPLHLLLLCLHHIVCDGWSLGILLRELAALYGAALAGARGAPAAGLPPLAVQYGDFAVWQRAWLTGEVLAGQLAYWRRQLAGAPALLALPTDRPRPAVQGCRGAQRTLALPAALADRLRELGRRQGTTLFMTLLAAWGVQLARLTGGEDLPIGSPIANRNRIEIEELIGFFANTLVLRLDLAGDPTCGELLGRVRELTLDAYAHPDLPFEKLVEELRPARALSHSPLFQVMFLLWRQEDAALALPGLRASQLALSGETAKFDLALAAAAAETGLTLGLEVNRDLFDAATAARLLSGLAALLEQFAGTAGRSAAELSLLSAGERHQLLAEWNDTGGGPPSDLALHQLVELQARRTPDAVAVMFGAALPAGAAGREGGRLDHLTYLELERQASRLAHRLAALGVGPEVRVGIAMERTAALVVGLLGILKAGGAYLPLDPAYPRERLAFILADAQQRIAAPLLLTEETLRARLPDLGGRILCLDGPGGLDLDGAGQTDGEATAAAAGPAQGGALPDSLAYVIYTSGSTGRPKGVAIPHRGAVALLRWAGELFTPAELAGVLASTSITFDLSVFELFLPLSRGGTVVLADNALALPGLPASAAVTLINTVPSAMAELLRIGGLPATVATVNLAGEPLKRALADKIHGELPGVRRVYNLYGPSEDTTYSTFARVDAGAGREPTIGRPISGTRAHVLDRRLQPLPAGVPGELCLGGEGLARGYLARPELTAQSFVPDPFGGRGERLYRTGDLVRRLPGGELDFLGRIDHQVKLRGFRIELGEIEAALLAHPRVGEAVVVAREDTPGRRRLVSYVTPAGGGDGGDGDGEPPPPAAALAAYLRQRLPDYMVPEACVVLGALPLTANGKVDRRALPPPEWRRDDGAPAFAAPRNPIEELVAGIWSEVLGIEPLGIHDRFFDLGGHSLLATQVISRVRRACAVEVPLRALFEAPGLEAFAARVEAARRSGEGGEDRAAAPLRRVPRDRPLPASFAQERLWFLAQLGAGGPAYNLAYALRLEGALAAPALAAALTELLRRHESLRTTFAADGEQLSQVIAPARSVPMPVLALGSLPDGARQAERRRLAAAAACRLFDLERGPLLRAILLRLSGAEHVLLLALHHIVSDGWSQRIFLGELAALYAAFAAGLPSPLPELPIQYADFAVWQREWLRGEALETHLAFWRRQLAGAPALLELPLDRPRPAVQSFHGAQRTAELPPSLTGELRALGRRQGVTLFMSLLAAFSTLLARYAGRDEVLIGTPIANRNRVETEGLIGCFVNTLVLRIDLAGDPTGGELLGRVREVTLAAYAHQDLPFEKLVEELRPRRNLSHAPLFQVLMILQNTRAAPAAAAGLTLAGEDVDHGTAKFDLNLALAEATGAAGDGRLRAALEYCRDLFFAATAERLLGHFAALAGGLAADPARRLSELPLLTPAERQQLVCEWNDSAAPYPRDLCLHEPFAAQAVRSPQAPALLFGEERWSYGELDRWSNRLARLLSRVGIGPGKLVGILVERRCEMVGAVLAVHKAGGAYVPLEVHWPPERLHWLLQSGGIGCLVTAAAQLPLLGALAELPELAHVVAVDAADGASAPAAATLWSLADFAALPAAPLPRRAGPGDLAYIIFTSGSTGRPKGVMVRHRPVLNLIHWINETFAIAPADRLLFVTALSFDLSVYDIFGVLAAGGSVRIARSEEVRDPEALVRILRREPVTFWDSAPAALQQLVPYLPAPAARAAPVTPETPETPETQKTQKTQKSTAGPPALRLVFLSGDWIPVTLPDRLREAFPRARVISLGGATEATVWSNWFPIGEVDPAWPSIPYGRPIPNARYSILDADANPCPIGVPGDLSIAGDCLSSGYFNAPELTAQAYRPDLSSGIAGARLYATGDRARYGAGGDIEFLGRVDSQVKVRGFRIELGEIESVLVSHEAVREAVVLAREDTPGDRRLVAYVIPAGEPPAARELRRFARRKLPDYMVPSAFVLRDSWPVSPNGKLDRQALPPPAAALAREAAALVPPRSALERTIAAVWREVIGLGEVGVGDNFFEVGGHSLLMARVQTRLGEAIGRTIPLVELFQHPTIGALATHLHGVRAAEPAARLQRPAPVSSSAAIALIGLAGRFPGAEDAAQFWQNLRAGVESIRFFSDEELAAAGFPAELLRDPRLVKARGMLDGAELFDAAFFGYAPREAQIIDPQQRLFLECAWEALEDAGYDSTRFGGRVGVFGGATENTYVLRLLTNPELLGAVGRHQIAIANNPDFLCTRVSYKLNLTGPSAAVLAACSTSLVAVHIACAALLRGDCDLALAGGVSVQARELSGYLYEEGGISSPDGHTRAFDAAARGVVGGSGVGIVVLRRLAGALAAGDTVRGVILGSAVNNDGNLKVSFTAPSVDGQAAVIREALVAAEVDPATVGYVEAHGTATPLGDPIEIAGLARAFGAVGPGSCALGSVKTNIGHLDAAAGIAGLIKTVLALEHRLIPPSLHFTRPNPTIDFAGTPFYVNSRLAEWPADGRPRRAGVSSFGIGGTNAHLVLEEAPPAALGSPSRPAQLLLLSARTAAALDRASLRLAERLERRPDLDLADVSHTLQVGRRAFGWRRMVVCRDRDEAAAALRQAAAGTRRAAGSRHLPVPLHPVESASGAAPVAGEAAPVVFLFPGQGTQYSGMAAELYADEPEFRAALDECSDLLAPHLGCDLRELLYPRRPAGGRLRQEAPRLAQTDLAQPALFAVEYALARLFMAWGIRPQAMLGHSIGELVAACLAGVFSLPDALRLVAERGRLMQDLPAGAMLAVEVAEEAVRPLLGEASGTLDLAAVNGPRSCVVSGPAPAVAALRRRLEERGVPCRLLHTSRAFHSAMMDPILAPFAELVAAVERRPPEIAWLSNVTGSWISPEEAVTPAYWARHLRQTVRFSDALAELAGGEAGEGGVGGVGVEGSAGGRRGQQPILLEVGPGRTLTILARQQAGEGWRRTAIASLPHARDRGSDLAGALGALGRLWLAGVDIAWDGFYAHERRRRVPLPTYPFERRRFWVDGVGRPGTAAAAGGRRMDAASVGAWEPPAEVEAAPEAAPAGAGFIAPRNEVEQGIAEIWRDLLGVERVGAEDDFFALGGSSLMAVQFGGRLRQRFGVDGASLLLEAPTLAELAGLVAARAGAAAEGAREPGETTRPSCLVRLQPGGAAGGRRPLFMVHQVGGHVFTFRALAHALGREIPVYGLRSRGLEEGEEPLQTVEEMAELYLGLVRGVQPNGPYRIGGASMGGMVAWEMAHRLRSAGEAVELLALMDTPCGEQMAAQPRADWEFVGAVLAGRVALTPAELAPLPLDQQLEYAMDKARQAGAGDDLTPAAARRLVEVLKANVAALYRYAPRPYPGRMLFFRARERRPVDPPRPELPWIELAEEGVEVVLVPGNHETMHAPPQVGRMADRLRSLL
jgi:amino acid adenylation domain-containing protein